MNSQFPNGEDLERIKKYARTEAGKKLIRELGRQKSDEINAAVQQGDIEKVRQLVQDFLKTTDNRGITDAAEESNG